MRLLRAVVVTALLVLGLGGEGPRAARDQSPPPAAARLELLVLEVRNCSVCELVRDHIQPAWERSPRAREVPMRYVDITTLDETKIGLKTPVDTLPTIVLMRDGQEVDRLIGYMGPELALRALGQMIEAAE